MAVTVCSESLSKVADGLIGGSRIPALPGPEVAGLVGAGPSRRRDEEEETLDSNLGGRCGI